MIGGLALFFLARLYINVAAGAFALPSNSTLRRLEKFVILENLCSLKNSKRYFSEPLLNKLFA